MSGSSKNRNLWMEKRLHQRDEELINHVIGLFLNYKSTACIYIYSVYNDWKPHQLGNEYGWSSLTWTTHHVYTCYHILHLATFHIVTPPTPTCPPDKPPVNCFANPCQVTSCPAHPEARCESDFCGGCNARFFDDQDKEVTDSCSEWPYVYVGCLVKTGPRL